MLIGKLELPKPLVFACTGQLSSVLAMELMRRREGGREPSVCVCVCALASSVLAPEEREREEGEVLVYSTSLWCSGMRVVLSGFRVQWVSAIGWPHCQEG